jgi:hypothetical protein
MTVNCSICGGTGWKPVEQDGVRRMIECDCRRSGRGFERADVILSETKDLGISPEMKKILRSAQNDSSNVADAVLTPHDKKIAAIVRNHIGREHAIRGRELAALVWPEESKERKYEGSVRRWLEDSIERLRTFARLPIAASKGSPMGYYIPATAEECDECHDRLFREGIRRIVDSQLFRRDRDLVERLRGQLELHPQISQIPQTVSAPSASSADKPEAR